LLFFVLRQHRFYDGLTQLGGAVKGAVVAGSMTAVQNVGGFGKAFSVLAVKGFVDGLPQIPVAYFDERF
jgi:hypothetical protein